MISFDEDKQVEDLLDQEEISITEPDVSVEPEVLVEADKPHFDEVEDVVSPDVVVEESLPELPIDNVKPGVVVYHDEHDYSASDLDPDKIVYNDSLTFHNKVEILKNSKDPTVKTFTSRLAVYCDNCKPGKTITDDKVVSEHAMLNSAIIALINSKEPYAKFKLCMDILKMFVHEYRVVGKVLYDNYMYRSIGKWKAGVTAYNTYTLSIFTILRLMVKNKDGSPGFNKAEIKRINFDMAFDQEKTMITVSGKEKLIRYFNIQ